MSAGGYACSDATDLSGQNLCQPFSGPVLSMHVNLTPRVGGIAIFGALAYRAAFAPIVIMQSYAAFLLGVSLLFFVGSKEDLEFSVSSRLRLLAVVVTSLIIIFCWMTGCNGSAFELWAGLADIGQRPFHTANDFDVINVVRLPRSACLAGTAPIGKPARLSASTYPLCRSSG